MLVIQVMEKLDLIRDLVFELECSISSGKPVNKEDKENAVKILKEYADILEDRPVVDF